MSINKKFLAWAPTNLFGAGVQPTSTSKTYTFKGVDTSWNHDPSHAGNWVYISNAKTPITFTVQVSK